MNRTIRFITLSVLASAATLASAGPVPLLTGDALHDEMLVMQAANGKPAAQTMNKAMAMTQKAAMPAPVLQYHATGDALTDEKLFTQQAQARRQMNADRGAMASMKNGTTRQ